MIVIRSLYEIDKLKESNRLVAEVLDKLKKAAYPGVSTIELDRIAESHLIKNGAKPAFKGYRGFPASLCVSVNSEVVHGIPSKKKLKSGDIVSLDFGSFYDGYYGDSAITLPIGKVSEEAKKLISVTKKALYVGIEKIKPGNRLSDVSNAIQAYVEGNGYSVVREFVGHGIGTSLHEEPQVPNFGPPGDGPILKKGMVLAIEPMVNVGTYDVKTLKDNWTVVTSDGALSAHFEHSVVVTDGEAKILSSLD